MQTVSSPPLRWFSLPFASLCIAFQRTCPKGQFWRSNRTRLPDLSHFPSFVQHLLASRSAMMSREDSQMRGASQIWEKREAGGAGKLREKWIAVSSQDRRAVCRISNRGQTRGSAPSQLLARLAPVNLRDHQHCHSEKERPDFCADILGLRKNRAPLRRRGISAPERRTPRSRRFTRFSPGPQTFQRLLVLRRLFSFVGNDSLLWRLPDLHSRSSPRFLLFHQFLFLSSRHKDCL